MGNSFGRNIRLSIFGESHGPAVGITIDGLLCGFLIDWEMVSAEMKRRAPGSSPLATPRRERDEWEILSGVFEGRTTGTPLTAIIRNENTDSSAYLKHIPRPGHADYAVFQKYKGFADYRGGGHFSGRLTAPLVFAGAIAKQILITKGIRIGARILSIAGIPDGDMPVEQMLEVSKKPFPVFSDDTGELMKSAILRAKSDGDSVGGVIECAALGVPAGLGEPFFDSVESAVSAMVFSVPGVKGIEFGDGFGLAAKRGSQANDGICMKDGEYSLLSNHAGGINGGITNGQPIVFRVAIKPTPTISKEQTTVDLEKRETVKMSFGGRHDPCIVPRAVSVIEAALAFVLLDFWMDFHGGVR